MKSIFTTLTLILALNFAFGQSADTAKGKKKPVRLISFSTPLPKYPLILVDGIEYTDSLNTIKPESIESVEVLKDAAATSIYGIKGAKGVVIVTTKKNKKVENVIKVKPRKTVSEIISLKKGSKVWVIVDDKHYDGNLDSIDTDNINEITVINDKEAVAFHTGEKLGKYDVVVLITTKQSLVVPNIHLPVKP